jgi:hypothetical protein
MKKKMITLMAFVLLAVTATFANGADISKDALAAFSNTFAKANNVKWEKNEKYDKASFQLNGQSLTALLSEKGEIIAVSRNILSTELPINLQVSFNKNFSGYWISDLVEYAIDGETTYYVTIENADEKTILESVGTYDWSLFKKMSK